MSFLPLLLPESKFKNMLVNTEARHEEVSGNILQVRLCQTAVNINTLTLEKANEQYKGTGSW